MTTKHLILTLLSIFLFSQATYGQSACYLIMKITDSRTSKPILGVSFTLDGRATGVQSDSLGEIVMPLSCDLHTVLIRMVGYKPASRQLSLPLNGPLSIEMENISTQLEEVIVTSQAAVRTMETPALGVSLLSMKAVQKLPPAAGEVDILRGLQMLPGISSVGEGANGINIRGGFVDQNLILLDNMPIFNPTHLLGLFSLFPTDAIREMQIYNPALPPGW